MEKKKEIRRKKQKNAPTEVARTRQKRNKINTKKRNKLNVNRRRERKENALTGVSAFRREPYPNPPHGGEEEGKMGRVIPLRGLRQVAGRGSRRKLEPRRVERQGLGSEREMRWVPGRGSRRKRELQRGCRRGKRQR